MNEQLIGFKNKVNEEKITSQNVSSWTARFFPSVPQMTEQVKKKIFVFTFYFESYCIIIVDYIIQYFEGKFIKMVYFIKMV